MKTTDKFELKLKYADEPLAGCTFRPARYRDNKNLALQVENADGPVCTCTVNPGEKLDDGVICVKDYSENQGMLAELRRLGVAGETVEVIPSGWVELKVVELTEQGKELFEGV